MNVFSDLPHISKALPPIWMPCNFSDTLSFMSFTSLEVLSCAFSFQPK